MYDYINVISDICATYQHQTNHATANVGWLHIICKSYFRAARRRASADTLMIAWEMAKRSFNQVKHHDRGCINSSTTCLIFTKVRHSKKTYWGDSGKILVTTKNIATGETPQAITFLTISTFYQKILWDSEKILLENPVPTGKITFFSNYDWSGRFFSEICSILHAHCLIYEEETKQLMIIKSTSWPPKVLWFGENMPPWLNAKMSAMRWIFLVLFKVWLFWNWIKM